MPRLFFDRRPFSPVATRCGHTVGKLTALVCAHGDSMELTLEPDRRGTVPFCHGCYADMAVKCDHCSGAIFVDKPVVMKPILTGTDEYFKLYAYGTIFIIGGMRYVARCGRRRCVQVSGLYHGIWKPGGTWQNDGRWWGGPQLLEDAFAKLKLAEERPKTKEDDYFDYYKSAKVASNDDVLRPLYLDVA